ncbi:MAG: deoxyribose-phosphate aldolase [Clostridia bacterium]|nr:deoxyribose-phosphate aldolase [Clostridia bacterium]
MEKREILSKVDHTLLRQDATWEEIRMLCDEGLQFRTASVCIPPAYVSRAAGYLQGRLPVCTVIGFPNGYSTAASKVFEAADAVEHGADEIDMVINIGMLKDKRFQDILSEIREIKAACGSGILKVIIETCLLTEEEKIIMCGIVSESGADFIKTSTGFAKGGATLEEIQLFKAHVAPHVRIKAAGGVKTAEDAIAFIEAGASRIGSSKIARVIAES